MFKKYNAIRNASNEQTIEVFKTLPIKAWGAFEKLDGANFCFSKNQGDDRLQLYSRTQQTTESFMGYVNISENYNSKVWDMLCALEHQFPDALMVQVYGELYGEGVRTASCVYGSKRFSAFDVRIQTSADEWQYLSPIETAVWFPRYDIPYIPMIAYGDLDTLLRLPLDAESSFIDCDTNRRTLEGYVIRPLERQVVNFDDRRVILKLKGSSSRQPKKRHSEPSVPEELKSVYDELCTFLTKERLHNVLSHQEYTSKDFNKIVGHFMLDVYDAYTEYTGTTISKKNWRVLCRLVNSQVVALVKPVYMEMFA